MFASGNRGFGKKVSKTSRIREFFVGPCHFPSPKIDHRQREKGFWGGGCFGGTAGMVAIVVLW
jgi:hypothetical protein